VPAPTPAPGSSVKAVAPAAARRAPATRIGLAGVAQEGDIDLDAALRVMIDCGGSDLHLTSGAQPMIRLDGGLRPLEGFR